MRKAIHTGAVLAGALAMSACASGPAGPTPNAARPSVATVPASQAATPAKATVNAPPSSDVATVIGQGAQSLAQRFGSARIDLTEGQARKLQFAGERCVLDVYLYPVAADTEPVATHVDARLRRDGSDTDKARCIAEVQSRQ